MKYITYFTDLTHTGAGVNSKGFPLGLGVVASYAIKHLPDQLSIELFKFPEDLNKSLKVKIPHFLCMSNVCFNKNLSYAFARYVKEKHPKTIVIFGGANIPTKSVERMQFLQAHPHIDFYIKWDGEVAFVSLVEKLIKYDLDITEFKKDKVISENCCYLIGRDEYIEGPDHRIQDLTKIPSPYTTGIFDKFFKQAFTPTFEITRGCPYSCTFCNDGNIFKRYVIRKSAEVITQELEYIATHTQSETELWICDDNFGMYKEDIEVGKIINAIIKKYNWPRSVQASNGKSHPERIIETSRIINQHNDGTLRFGSSLQSSDAEVLKNIKRKNLPLGKLLEFTNIPYSNNNKINFFTELILGLPGDSLQKHYDSLRYAIDQISVCNLDVHQLNLLHGAELDEPNSIEQYEMDIRYRVFVGCFGIYNIGDSQVPCAEIDKTVVGNSTLSYEDYIECRIMNLLVKIFIDHDPFREVLGFIRKLNLSVFELLIILRQRIIHKYGSLTDLITEFVEKTKKPLYKDIKELEIFLSKEETIKDYISGKLGGNELLNCRAKAYLECIDDLHSALKESILFNLTKHNLLTPENEDYVIQTIQFSHLRKFDINNINEVKCGEFTYDFIKASEAGYQAYPNQLRIAKTKFKFLHDNETLDYIKKRIDFWGGDEIDKIGKLFQKTNMEIMARKVYLA